MRGLRGIFSSKVRGYKDNHPPEEVRFADPTMLSPEHWQQLLCFVHIPKCAGTSFKNVLWNVYGSGFITYHKRISKYVPQEMTEDQAKGILALSGHLPYGYHEMFGTQSTPDGVFANRNVMYISVVRNPTDRVISLARFIRTFPQHKLYQATKNMSFEEFFEYAQKEIPGVLGNLQSSLLTAGRPKEAIEFAGKNYIAVATIESADAMIAALGKRLGWPDVQIEQKNRSPSDMTDDHLKATVEQFCKENCKFDIALYEHIAGQPEGFIIRDV